ncbi:MAG: hypothetical protein ACD_62C00432G0007, partial [uncultured bacterium]
MTAHSSTFEHIQKPIANHFFGSCPGSLFF